MERVSTLVEKIKLMLDQNASVAAMLQTVEMLHAELVLNIKPEDTNKVSNRIMVITPTMNRVSTFTHHEDDKPTLIETPVEEEKIIEVLQVDENEIEEELNEIKRNAEVKNQMSAHARPVLLFDPIEDVPTLTHQTPLKKELEINSSTVALAESINDRLKESKLEMGDKLTETPIKDLKKAIGINDRFLFINELFRGDEAMYERSIKTINNFTILPEAQYWIQRELKVKIGWKDSDVVKQFDQLVKRRFG